MHFTHLCIRNFRPSMRIDKFLWCIRVFKTRSLAADQCRLQKVWLNNELIKASREVKPGDIIGVRKGPFQWSWSVITFPTSRVGAKLVPLYAKDVTPEAEKEKMEMFRLQQHHDRPRGLGRPTKKDRRSLDDFFSDLDEEPATE